MLCGSFVRCDAEKQKIKKQLWSRSTTDLSIASFFVLFGIMRRAFTKGVVWKLCVWCRISFVELAATALTSIFSLFSSWYHTSSFRFGCCAKALVWCRKKQKGSYGAGQRSIPKLFFSLFCVNFFPDNGACFISARSKFLLITRDKAKCFVDLYVYNSFDLGEKGCE